MYLQINAVQDEGKYMKTNEQMIEALKVEVVKNPTFNAMCHVFALRRRTRSTIMVASLIQKMDKEGFNFDKASYIKTLQFLADVDV